MGARGFLTLAMLLTLAGNISLMLWWSISSADWSLRDMLLFNLTLVVATALSLIAVWTVNPAARGGVLSRSAVIGMHLVAMGVVWFATYPSMAAPPMLVVFVSMILAFTRFVRTPLPD